MWNLKKLLLPVAIAALMIPACAPAAVAQPPHPPRPPMQQEFHMHFGRWWDNPHVAKDLGLSHAQQKRMDQIFEHYKPKLMALHDNLHKQEAALGPMLGVTADNPNESRILAQIDTVAQARANLEKEFARMLLGIRRQLTPEQWQKLKAEHQKHMEQQMKHNHDHGPHGPH